MKQKPIKIIFLDFDGVLITLESIKTNNMETKADPRCIAALNRITDATKAKIVVSSTWRLFGISKIREYLTLWGVTGELFGLTPDLSTMYHNGLYAFERLREISIWLNLCPEPVASFVVLDDDQVGEAPILIKTEFERGLTNDHADCAIKLLKRSRRKSD